MADNKELQSSIVRFKQKQDNRLRNSYASAMNKTPEEHARVNSIVEETGIDPDIASRNIAIIEKQKKARELNVRKLREENPAIHKFLSRSEQNMQLSYNRLDELMEAESKIKGRSVVGASLRNAGTQATSLLGNLTSFLGKANEQYIRLGNKLTDGSYQDGVEKKSFIEDDLIIDASKGVQRAGRNIKEHWEESFDYLPIATWQNLKDEKSIENLAGFITEQAGGSIAHMAAIVTSLPAYIASRTEEFAVDRADNDNRETQGKDYIIGAVGSVTVAMLERIVPAGLLDDAAITTFKSGLANAAKTGGKEAATEFVQEQIEYLTTNAGTQEGWTFAESLDRGLAGAVGGGGTGIVLGGAQSALNYQKVIADEAIHQDRVVMQSDMEQDQIDAINTLAQSGLKDLSELASDELITDLAEQYDIDAVYISQDNVPNSEIEGAAVTKAGDDLVIPLGDYVKLSQENREAIREHVRLSPDTLSISEDDGGMIQRMSEKAKTDIKMIDDIKAVHKDIMRQLVEAEVMTPREARLSAAIIPAYLSTRATSEGLTVEELYKEMGLEIKSGALSQGGSDVLFQAKETGYTGQSETEAEAWNAAVEKIINNSLTQEQFKKYFSEPLESVPEDVKIKIEDFTESLPSFLKKQSLSETIGQFNVSEEGGSLLKKQATLGDGSGGVFFQSVKDQTQTEAFKEWFGDSKVVDENGEPLVVYHGTGNLAGLDAFDPSLTGQGADQYGSGFYFTNFTSTASGYTEFTKESDIPKLGGEGSAGIAPVFLSIQNPIKLTTVDNRSINDSGIDLSPEQVREILNYSEALKRDENDERMNPVGDHFNSFWGGGVESWMLDELAETYSGEQIENIEGDLFDEDSGAFREALRDVTGYDGVEITMPESGEKHFVAWFPEQIKSSIGNSGEFDPNDSRILHQFAGKGSVNHNAESLALARELQKKGESKSSIRRKTGWHYGVDSLWRYEISDAKANFIQSSLDEVLTKENDSFIKINKLLDHPELFKAYPDMEYIYVKIKPKSDIRRGSYNPKTDEITLYSGEPEAMLSTLLHELQHAIQEREGFARGGAVNKEFADGVKDALKQIDETIQENIATWKIDNSEKLSENDLAAEVARNSIRYESMQRLFSYSKRDKPSGVFRLIRNEMQWIYDTRGDEVASDLQRRFYDIPKRHKKDERNAFLSKMSFDAAQWLGTIIPKDQMAAFEKDKRTVKGMINALSREADKATAKLQPLRNLEKRAKEVRVVKEANEHGSAYDIYRSLAGEIEARNTQTRQKLTDQERIEFDPELTADVPASDAIVLFGGMEISAPMVMMSQSFENAGDDFRNRAQVEFFGDKSIITLSKASDLSSFFHESAHVFLEMERKFSARGNASDRQKSEFQKILKFLEVEKSEDIGREQHEKFARGFEAYLFEGKAPSIELQSMFRRFKQWLIQVYKNFRNLNVELDDEIRGVFDRMLATDEQIDRLAMQSQQLALDEPVKANGSARAKEDLGAKLLRLIRKKATDDWKQELADRSKSLEQDIEEEPVYVAINTLNQNKISRSAVKELLGIKSINEMPRLKGLTSEEGAEPEAAAELLGFASAEKMLNAINETKPIKAEAKERVEVAMIDEYGDILNNGSLEEEALRAYHNDEQASQLIQELRALKAKPQEFDKQALRASAEAQIGRTVASQIRPSAFRRAEVKNAQKSAAALAEGNTDAAKSFKLEQLRNFYLFKAASNAVTNGDKWRKHLNGVKSRDYKTSDVNPAYLANLKLLANSYDLKANPQQTSEGLSKLADWVQSQIEASDYIQPQVIDINLIALLQARKDGTLDDVKIKSFKDMTVDEQESVYYMARHLRAMGGKLADSKKANRKARNEMLAAEAGKLGVKKHASKDELDKWEHIKTGVSQFINDHVTLRQQVFELDGNSEFGAWQKELYKPIIDGTNKEISLTQPIAEKLAEALKSFKGAAKNKKTITKSNGDEMTLTNHGRMMLAMYMGTESSLESLMEGHNATKVDLLKMVSLMSEAELDSVNTLWEINESLWPEMAKNSVDLTGVSPPKVQATPYYVNGKRMTGGHMRIYYNKDARDSKRDKLEDDNFIGNHLTMTKSGTMNARVGGGGRQVSLDPANITRSLSESIHVISFSKAGRAAAGILNSDTIAKSVSSAKGQEFLDSVRSNIKGIMKIDAPTQNALTKAMKYVRNNMALGLLGLSVRNAVQQPAAFTNVIGLIGGKHALKGMLDFYSDFSNKMEFIKSNSQFMNKRTAFVNREANEALGGLERAGWLKQSAFVMQTALDSLVAYGAWTGAYNKAKADFNNPNISAEKLEAKAITYADETVAQTVGSGLAKDLSPLLQGSGSSARALGGEFQKQFTFMGTFFGVQFNLMRNVTKRTDFKNPKDIANWTFEMAMYTAAPALISTMAVMSFPDDEESKLKWAAEETAFFGLQSVFGLRDLVSVHKGFKPSLPMFQGLVGAYGLTDLAYEAGFGEEDLNLEDAENLIRNLQPLFPFVGSGQLARYLDYQHSYNEGKEGEYNPYQGLVEGRDKD